MKPREHTSLQCIYCDDIRDEVGGKTTIIGWYGGEDIKLPPDGPLPLLNLCVIGLLAMPLGQKHKSLRMELLRDEIVFESVNIPPDTVNETQSFSNGQSMGREFRMAIKMSNMTITDPCVLRMRIVVDNTEIYGNGLRFAR